MWALNSWRWMQILQVAAIKPLTLNINTAAVRDHAQKCGNHDGEKPAFLFHFGFLRSPHGAEFFICCSFYVFRGRLVPAPSTNSGVDTLRPGRWESVGIDRVMFVVLIFQQKYFLLEIMRLLINEDDMSMMLIGSTSTHSVTKVKPACVCDPQTSLQRGYQS